jgi:hypothetical protein
MSVRTSHGQFNTACPFHLQMKKQLAIQIFAFGSVNTINEGIVILDTVG